MNAQFLKFKYENVLETKNNPDPAQLRTFVKSKKDTKISWDYPFNFILKISVYYSLATSANFLSCVFRVKQITRPSSMSIF
jgi:hypothetical protein